MKKLAFEYAGSFDMPSMKMVKIEKENVMFTTTTSVFDYNKGASSVSARELALDLDLELAKAEEATVTSA